jgi:hypothetical protein
MGGTSAIARGVRTFLAVVAGCAATWATIDWTTDFRLGAWTVAFNLITALLAGVSAAALAAGGKAAVTPIGKAIATFFQTVGAGLAPLAVNVAADLAPTGRLVLSTVIAAVFGAIATLTLNASEAAAQPG